MMKHFSKSLHILEKHYHLNDTFEHLSINYDYPNEVANEKYNFCIFKDS